MANELYLKDTPFSNRSMVQAYLEFNLRELVDEHVCTEICVLLPFSNVSAYELQVQLGN